MGRNLQKFAQGAVEIGAGALITLIPGGQGVGVFLMEAGLATTAGSARLPRRAAVTPSEIARSDEDHGDGRHSTEGP